MEDSRLYYFFMVFYMFEMLHTLKTKEKGTIAFPMADGDSPENSPVQFLFMWLWSRVCRLGLCRGKPVVLSMERDFIKDFAAGSASGVGRLPSFKRASLAVPKQTRDGVKLGV